MHRAKGVCVSGGGGGGFILFSFLSLTPKPFQKVERGCTCGRVGDGNFLKRKQ